MTIFLQIPLPLLNATVECNEQMHVLTIFIKQAYESSIVTLHVIAGCRALNILIVKQLYEGPNPTN